MKTLMWSVLAVGCSMPLIQQSGQAAWVGDIIYCANSKQTPPYNAGVAVAFFDFTHKINGEKDGYYINRDSPRYEPLCQNDFPIGARDAVFNARSIIMYDEDTALVLCAGRWDDMDHKDVSITQLEYDLHLPYERDPGPLSLSEIVPTKRGTVTGGILTGRLQLAVHPEKEYALYSMYKPIAGKLFLPELTNAGMFGSHNVMDMAANTQGDLYIAGCQYSTQEGMVFLLRKAGGRALGRRVGERIGESMFREARQIVSKKSGRSWFTGIAVDNRGYVYAVDRGLGCLDIYTADGKPVGLYDVQRELACAPEAVRVDPTHAGPETRLVLVVRDPRKEVKIVVLDVNPSGPVVKIAKKLVGDELPKSDHEKTASEWIGSVEMSPNGDLFYVDCRGYSEASHCLIAAEEYAKAVGNPDGGTYTISPAGVNVLYEQGYWYGRGATFAAVRSPGRDFVNGSLNKIGQGQAREALIELEPMLDRCEAEPAQSPAVSTIAADRVVQTCMAIASAKRQIGASTEDLRAVYYEAIRKAPNSSVVRDAVAALDQTLEPTERRSFLWHLARTQRLTAVGQAAANEVLAETLSQSKDYVMTLQHMAAQGDGTAIADIAIERLGCRSYLLDARAILGAYSSRAESMFLSTAGTDDSSYGDLLISLSATPYLNADWPGPRTVDILCQTVLASRSAKAITDSVRTLMIRTKLKCADYLGAVAAAAAVPVSSDIPVLFRELAHMQSADQIRQRLVGLIKSIRNASMSSSPPNTSAAATCWLSLAEACEVSGLGAVALVSRQEYLREQAAVPTDVRSGTAITDGFDKDVAAPVELQAFWKAHVLLQAAKRVEAAQLLGTLCHSDNSVMRAQALFDLARIRLLQHHIEEADKCVEECAESLPNGKALPGLRAQIREAKQHRQALSEAYARIGDLRQQADTEKDADRVTGILAELADVELQIQRPQRAANVLEESLRRYPRSVRAPAALSKLAGIYREQLQDDSKAQQCLARLAENPGSQPPVTQPSR